MTGQMQESRDGRGRNGWNGCTTFTVEGPSLSFRGKSAERWRRGDIKLVCAGSRLLEKLIKAGFDVGLLGVWGNLCEGEAEIDFVLRCACGEGQTAGVVEKRFILGDRSIEQLVKE